MALPKPYYQDSAVQIFHGDCREIVPNLTDCVGISDPPYGVGVQYGEYNDSPRDYWDWFLPCLVVLKSHLKPLVFTHGSGKRSLEKITGYDWIGVWMKPGAFGARIGNSCVLPHWEPIFMFNIHGLGPKSQYTSDVFVCNPEPAGVHLKIGREKWQATDFTDHPCPKPEKLYRQLILAFAQNNETICDPFMGSGTTLRAAKDLGRKAIGIEICEKYCEIAALRMQQEVLPLGICDNRSIAKDAEVDLQIDMLIEAQNIAHTPAISANDGVIKENV